SAEDLREIEPWQRAFLGQSKDHRFYEITNETLGPNFEHHYLVIEDRTGAVRGIQPVFFLQQNLVEGIPAIRPVVEKVREKFPRFLTMRLLMVGNVAGEGHLSGSSEADEQFVAEALREILPAFARQAKASLIVFKDFPASYRQTLASL